MGGLLLGVGKVGQSSRKVGGIDTSLRNPLFQIDGYKGGFVAKGVEIQVVARIKLCHQRGTHTHLLTVHIGFITLAN